MTRRYYITRKLHQTQTREREMPRRQMLEKTFRASKCLYWSHSRQQWWTEALHATRESLGKCWCHRKAEDALEKRLFDRVQVDASTKVILCVSKDFYRSWVILQTMKDSIREYEWCRYQEKNSFKNTSGAATMQRIWYRLMWIPVWW